MKAMKTQTIFQNEWSTQRVNDKTLSLDIYIHSIQYIHNIHPTLSCSETNPLQIQ